MLVDIILLVVVLMVAVLIYLDVRKRSESPGEEAAGQARAGAHGGAGVENMAAQGVRGEAAASDAVQAYVARTAALSAGQPGR